MPLRMLVTGGAGFLGSHIVARAVAEGFEVTVVDDLSRGIFREGPFRFVRGDVNVAAVVDDLEPADVVVHCAAVCGVESCLADPRRVIDDFTGTENLCRYAERHAVERFVFLSSGEVYGADALGAGEDDDVRLWNVAQPRVNYALGKLLGEARVRTLTVPHLTIRPFNVFGPGQIGAGVVRNFMRWAGRGEPLQVYNRGREVRALCYVADFVDGLFAAMAAGERFPVYNLGNPHNAMTVTSIAAKVLEVSGSPSTLTFVPREYPDKRGVTPDIARAMATFGFSPTTSLDDGLRAMLAQPVAAAAA
jgi:nucleoside-diphosphate-sugar epimerase